MNSRSQIFALMSGVSALAICTPAFSQAGANPEGAAVEEIVITGSRIGRTTFETPTPVTAITEAQLDSKAATSIIDLLRDIPALRPNRTTGSGRNIGVSNFNMRSLGSVRTLVLLDGQRMMDSSPVGGFDLNVIPAPLVSRMEIVTAGASSVYGSDAVTGVVNVVLNNTLQGGRADVQYTNTFRNDKEGVTASLAYGTGFAGERGRVIVAASYNDSPDLLYQGARDWGRQGYTLIPNPTYTATNGQFRQFIVPNVRLSNMTKGGLITSAGPLKNVQFGPNGQQSLFVQGTNVSTIWMEGGAGLMTQPDYGVIAVGQKQESVFSRVNYDLTDSIEAHVDVLATRSRNESTNNFNYNNADITIRRDNPYLPANILATMVASNLQTITMGRLNPETGLNTNVSRNHYYRFSAGLKGPLPKDWTWELGINYTTALAQNSGYNNRNQANWSRAIDVVTGPNGQPICRSTLTDPTNGCAPANLFGEGAVSAAVVNYVVGTSFQRSFSRSVNASANVGGELGATWAGPIRVAAGAEYREDKVNSKSDAVSDANGWRQGTFASYRGDVSVSEVYGETSIPLARDTPLAQSVDLDLAARYVDYSTSGTAKVWKTGLNWTVSDLIRFRGTYSKDFRAPKIDDLFSASSLRAGNNVTDFQGNRATVVNVVTGGNPNLKPEIAHTITAGVVISPAEGLQFSADFFDIDLKDALTTFTAQQVVDRCGLGDAQFCAGILRNAAGVITQVNTTQFNAQTLKTSGVDLELSYRMPLETLVSSWNGSLQLRTMGTYVDKLITTTGGPQVDSAGQLSGNGTPKWRVSTTAIYTNGPLTLRALVNYIGGAKYDNSYGPLDLNKQHFGSVTYVDISTQYDITEGAQLYAKIENLFDKDPPLISNGTITIAGASGSGFYDNLGRTYGVGIRYRW
jgi:outer membrane receptor protein involved in Fe transport